MTAVVALTVTACSEDGDEPTPEVAPTPTATPIPPFDADQPAARAVLPLVPVDATELRVTDWEQVRLRVGREDITSAAPRRQRDQFWRKVDRNVPLLDTGLLRPDAERLLADYSFTQDDVAWEAHFETPRGSGWVLLMDAPVLMADVERAVDDGVGALRGAEVDVARRLVMRGVSAEPEESWAMAPELGELVDDTGESTYVRAGCLDADAVLGTVPDGSLARLQPLGGFVVVLAGRLATVYLGTDRADAFARARLDRTSFSTAPQVSQFQRAWGQAVADPSSGRLGYRMRDDRAATELMLDGDLPFAVCDV